MKDDGTLWQEVLQRLAKIEENTKNLDSIAEKARTALVKSEANEREIAEMQENQKWVWRTVVGIGVSVAVYFITKLLGG